jgi:tetratricopeptide (TPR) repeat protein
VPENTKQKPSKKISIDVTRVSSEDELQSAKILFQEGLLEEAKKKLFQILIAAPNYQRAHDLLKQIQSHELKSLLGPTPNHQRPKKTKTEDPVLIIDQLNADLGLGLDLNGFDPDQENWVIQTELSAREHFDVGVAFFEMGCYRDAIRELRSAERQIRMEQTFLGELGVSVVALHSEALVQLGRAYEAKAFLEPVLSEPDLKREEKNVLFYVMGLVEESLGKLNEARGWFQKVFDLEPDFRDTRFRLKQFQ